MHAHAPFFFGMVEGTSVFLTIWDVCLRFSQSSALGWTDGWVYSFSRIAFAVTFIIIRLILWPIFVVPIWKGSIDLVRSAKAHNNFVVSFYLLSSVFMTFLQLMWGRQIVTGLAQMLGLII